MICRRTEGNDILLKLVAKTLAAGAYEMQVEYEDRKEHVLAPTINTVMNGPIGSEISHSYIVSDTTGMLPIGPGPRAPYHRWTHTYHPAYYPGYYYGGYYRRHHRCHHWEDDD